MQQHNQNLINVSEIVRTYEHDKECFTEMMYKEPYNSKPILVEVIRRLIATISQKNQMIEDMKKAIKALEENQVETERILGSLINKKQSH